MTDVMEHIGEVIAQVRSRLQSSTQPLTFTHTHRDTHTHMHASLLQAVGRELSTHPLSTFPSSCSREWLYTHTHTHTHTRTHTHKETPYRLSGGVIYRKPAGNPSHIVEKTIAAAEFLNSNYTIIFFNTLNEHIAFCHMKCLNRLHMPLSLPLNFH